MNSSMNISSSKSESMSLYSTQRMPLGDSNRSLSSLLYVNSSRKSNQNTPQKLQDSCSSKVVSTCQSKLQLSNQASKADEKVFTESLVIIENTVIKNDLFKAQQKLEKYKGERQKLKDAKQLMQNTIDSLEKNLEEISYQNDIFEQEVSEYSKTIIKLEEDYKSQLYEKEQDIIHKIKSTNSRNNEPPGSSQIRNLALEKQLEEKMKIILSLNEQNLILIEKDQVNQDRINNLEQSLDQYEQQYEKVLMTTQRNEINIDKFFQQIKQKEQDLAIQMLSLRKEITQIEFSTQTEPSYQSEDQSGQLQTLCYDLNEKLWEKKLIIELENISQQKTQISQREKVIQQKEDKIFLFYKQLKESHQIEL